LHLLAEPKGGLGGLVNGSAGSPRIKAAASGKAANGAGLPKPAESSGMV